MPPKYQTPEDSRSGPSTDLIALDLGLIIFVLALVLLGTGDIMYQLSHFE